MRTSSPKNSREVIWTRHAVGKMRQYNLSESRLKSLLRNPVRREQGIVPGTVALMQPAGTKRPTEIWLMYQYLGPVKKIITAWRYPGISQKKEIPIPDEIRDFIRNNETQNY